MIDLSINFSINKEVRQKILIMQNKLKKFDPSQNFVPELKLHCTVKSCGLLGKQINENVIPEVIEKTEKLLKNVKPFRVQLRGIQNFPNVIFINVISKDSKLIELHNLLNDNIPYSEYSEFEGKRYKSHTTIVELINPSPRLFAELDKYKNYDFGEMKVDTINIILGGDASLEDKFNILKSFKLRTKR